VSMSLVVTASPLGQEYSRDKVGEDIVDMLLVWWTSQNGFDGR
jgi:hypothetical protein